LESRRVFRAEVFLSINTERTPIPGGFFPVPGNPRPLGEGRGFPGCYLQQLNRLDTIPGPRAGGRTIIGRSMSVREHCPPAVAGPRSRRSAATTSSPFLILLSGLPGTGKSTLVRRLSRRLGAVVVESDAVRLSLTPEPTFSVEESARVFDLCHARIADLLGKGVPAILGATSLKEEHRLVPIRIAEAAGATVLIIEVDAPRAVVRERLQRRAEEGDLSLAGWPVYLRMRRGRDRIEGPHFTVDGSSDTGRAVAEIVDAVKREIEEGHTT